MPSEAACPQCNEVSRNRICSNCHSKLPNDIDSSDDMIFAVIGAKETGKSHYIAVLINIIKNVLSVSFDFAMQAATEETIRRYQNDFYRRIFVNKETITATQSGVVSRDVREPLIFLMKFQGKGFLSNQLRTVTLVFFDTAGEDLNEEDTMLTINKYIYNSSGIIFLLDPLQIDTVRHSLPPGTPLPAVNTEIESIVTRTTNMIRKAKKLKMNKKIDIPVAVAFTKIDALYPILDASSSLRSTARHNEMGKFDKNSVENVSMEIEAMLRNWAGNDFAQQISINFSNYSYFGLSALGCNPQDTKKIERLLPHRVEDPFLWLLWKKGIIK